MDILIEGIQKRNRALEGDEVIVLIEPPGDWKVLNLKWKYILCYLYK